MANQLETSLYRLNNILVFFMNSIKFTKFSYRDLERDFAKTEYAKGATLDYRLQERYLTNSGSTLIPSAINQQVRSLTITHQEHVGFEYLTLSDLTLDRAKDLPLLADRYESGSQTLAQKVDGDLATGLWQATYHATPFLTTLGANISNQSPLNKVRGFMTKLGIPEGDRHFGLNIDDSLGLADGNFNTFYPRIHKAATDEGKIDDLVQFNLFETHLLQHHYAGTAGTSTMDAFGTKPAGTVTGATATTISVTGAAANATFKKGDIIQIQDNGNGACNFVNQVDKKDTGVAATFVVTADTPTDGSGVAVIPVSGNPLLGPTAGALQTITRAVTETGTADGIRLYQNHDLNVAYHRKGLVAAVPKLKGLDQGVNTTWSYDPKYKISIRFMSGADIRADQAIDRLDVAYGWSINPEFCVRLMTNITTVA